jgi:large subunit ribosomal protein L23
MSSTTEHARSVILAPVWTEKSAAQIEDNQYTFRIAEAAHKTQVKQAVEEIWAVRVTAVRIINVRPKPKRRGIFRGHRPGFKKAVVTLAPGDKITLLEGMV